jgi:cyclic pyranopterin phosphate synthase
MDRQVLRDSFGRVVDDLRISVTDRCNFRCVYCMPEHGMKWLPKAEILSYEEILRIAAVMFDLGVSTVRLTGGEPLVRPDIEVLVRGLRRLKPDADLSMTTNGFFLPEKARALAAAGLNRVNVSLDSMHPDRFERLVRVDRKFLAKVLEGLEAAIAAGLGPVKANVVLMRGMNEDEVLDFARLARVKNVQFRFIEFMPLDAEGGWSRDTVIPGADVLRQIDQVFPLEPVTEARPEPATRYRFKDGVGGGVGFINSVSEPFCGTCNRIRLTADGQIRTCLFSTREHDVKSLLRSGASDEEMKRFITRLVWTKEPGHRINEPDFVKPTRSMSAIGG